MNDSLMNRHFLTLIFALVISFAVPNPSAASSTGFAFYGEEWPGFWFVCEFSQRQRAPDDGCKMFDDEALVHLQQIQLKLLHPFERHQ